MRIFQKNIDQAKFKVGSGTPPIRKKKRKKFIGKVIATAGGDVEDGCRRQPVQRFNVLAERHTIDAG